MKKSHIFFGLAILTITFHGIERYNSNADCYEIVPPQGKFDTILLDKCQGRTFLSVREEVDNDGDGKMDGYSYRWAGMRSYKDGEVFWEK